MRRQGFSLIEMLVVLVIVGLLGGLAVARFGLPPRLVLDQTSRAVVAALRHAQRHAITQGRPVMVQVSPTTREMIIQATQVAQTLPKGISITATGAETVQERPDQITLVLYPDGTASGLDLILGGGGAQRLVIVHWLTGQVEVTDHAK